MPRQRIDEYVGEGLEEASFNIEPTWTAPLIATPSNLDLATVRSGAIPDPTYVVDGGERQDIEGPSHSEIGVPWSNVAEGVRTSPAAGSAPSETLQTLMLHTVTQGAVEAHDTDVIAAAPAPSATGFTVDTSGSHDLTGIGMVALEYGGAYYSRPCTVTADAVTLLMAAPGVPVAGDELPGGLILPYVHSPATLTSAAYRFLGNDSKQNSGIRGSVARLSIPDVGPMDLPVLDFVLQGGSYENDIVDTRPASDSILGRVMSGGEILLAAYGQTDYLAICGRIAVTDMRAAWNADQCMTPDGHGLDGWSPTKKAFVVTLQIPHSFIPSDLTGLTDTSWNDAWREGREFHLMTTYGLGTPGRGFSDYFRRLTLKQPERAEVDEQDFRTLTFVPSTGYDVDTEQPAVFHEW